MKTKILKIVEFLPIIITIFIIFGIFYCGFILYKSIKIKPQLTNKESISLLMEVAHELEIKNPKVFCNPREEFYDRTVCFLSGENLTSIQKFACYDSDKACYLLNN